MTGRQKNSVLLSGFIIMLLIAYQFSFKKTAAIKTNLNKLKNDKALLSNANEQIACLQGKNKYLDSILKSNDVSTNQSFEQNLFQKITRLSKGHKTEIVSFEKPHIYVADGANLLTFTIEMKGSFRDLMLFSSNLEKQQLGKISSTSFIKKKNYRTRRNELFCTTLLQKLSK